MVPAASAIDWHQEAIHSRDIYRSRLTATRNSLRCPHEQRTDPSS
jgi:hypothetical protein